MRTTIAEADLKTHFRVDLSILALNALCVGMQLGEGRFFSTPVLMVGLPGEWSSDVLPPETATCQMRCREWDFSFAQKSH